MKNFKRIANIATASILAACMVAPMAVTNVSAATAGNITIKKSVDGGLQTVTTNTYKAYRIFTGTVDATGELPVLNDIQWANSSNASTFLANLKADSYLKDDFKDCDTAAAVAKVLASFNNDSEKAKAFAEFAVKNSSLLESKGTSNAGVITLNDTDAADGATDDGYYVIAQTTYVGETTSYLLGVYDASEGADITIKTAAPTLVKKIKDVNDSTEAESGWQDSADYDIGDQVPFQLTATLPTDFATYNEYKLVFHDKLDDSFTYITDTQADNFVQPQLYVAGELIGNINPVTTACGDDCNLEFVIEDVKGLAGAAANGSVVIEFSAVLNEDAVIGTNGNWNEAYLEYSNNPYYTSGTGGDSTDDGDDEIDNDGDGEVDEDDEDQGETTDETEKDLVGAFTYETIINKVDEKGNPLTGANFKLEKKIGLEGNNWETIAYVENTPGTTFTFTGLDDGTYKLSETATPSGYNTITGGYIQFDITADHVVEGDTKQEITITKLMGVEAGKTGEDAKVTLSGHEALVDVAAGSINANIVNKSGTTLPGTGGIGTTLFYLGGGAMVGIAGIYLISKKRMKNNEQ